MHLDKKPPQPLDSSIVSKNAIISDRAARMLKTLSSTPDRANELRGGTYRTTIPDALLGTAKSVAAFRPTPDTVLSVVFGTSHFHPSPTALMTFHVNWLPAEARSG